METININNKATITGNDIKSSPFFQKMLKYLQMRKEPISGFKIKASFDDLCDNTDRLFKNIEELEVTLVSPHHNQIRTVWLIAVSNNQDIAWLEWSKDFKLEHNLMSDEEIKWNELQLKNIIYKQQVGCPIDNKSHYLSLNEIAKL